MLFEMHKGSFTSVLSLSLLACLANSGVLRGSDALQTDPPFDWSVNQHQAKQAKWILGALKDWRKTLPSSPHKALRVVYFHPSDRPPLKNYLERWDAIMSDMQDFYRSEMEYLNYGKVSITLERENGKLKLHQVRGKSKDDGSYTYKSGGKIREEVFASLKKKGIDPNRETILIVCGLSKTEGKKVTIYSPYYGMGANHNRGICFTADMEWLSVDGLKPDPENITLQVKEHRGYEPFTLGRFNTVYIGGTIHELGHGLSLPHNLATKEESKRGTALMGAGNYTYRKEWRNQGKGSFLTHSSALRLLVHPLFTGTSIKTTEAPNLKFQELEVAHFEKQIQIVGKIEFGIPAIAMIAYNDRENKGQRGYMVNNNYDATSWTSVISPDKEFKINIADLRPGNFQIRLVAVHANGAVTTKRMHYSITDGSVDFSKTKGEIENILRK
tara:strand:- start:62 stop:1387 length:1326 start_codon:yes stop_codon:yes gene_type:complete